METAAICPVCENALERVEDRGLFEQWRCAYCAFEMFGEPIKTEE